MLVDSIAAEFVRLQIHPVNLAAVSESNGTVVLSGSLMGFWKVPKSIDGNWFLKMLRSLPGELGPKSTMDAFYAAYAADLVD